MANKVFKTAVEQLKEEFFSYADPYHYFSEEDKWVITEREFLELIEKFKAMENEQMSNAMLHGWRKALDEEIHSIDPNDFYNETFKSE